MVSARVKQLTDHLASAPEWFLPAVIGDSVEDVDTPALILDAAAMLKNLRKMRALVPRRISLRPHYKTHKSLDIAAIQLLEGADGLCCAKLAEAETIAYGRVSPRTLTLLGERGLNEKSMRLDILITNEVGILARKMDRLGKLARDLLRGGGRDPRNRLGVCVDGEAQIHALAEMSKKHFDGDMSIDVYVELNHGGNRCGVDTPEQVVALAKTIRDAGSSLVFRGIHAYIGTVQHIRDYEQRKAKNGVAAQTARTAVRLLEAEGFQNLVVTGSGTGTFEFDIQEGSVYTEIQVGSYLFLDRDYSLNLAADSTTQSPFVPSLFILSSIISHQPPRVVIDAGWKSVDMFVCFPSVAKPEAEVEYIPGGDEHGVIVPKGMRKRDGSVDQVKAEQGISLFAGKDWSLGQKLWLLVSHCDPTVNLHDVYVVIDEGKVVDFWRIARGPGL